MDIRLPQLAEGVESGTVVSILVSEGDPVNKDQPIMELETQKAVGSIPSPQSGIVAKIHVKEGMEVAVGQVLISVSTDATPETPPPGDPDASRSDQEAPKSQALLSPAESISDIGRKNEAQETRRPEEYRYESKSGVPPPAAPTIRKLARELGINLTRVPGSESGGRIVLEDLRAYIDRLQRIAFEHTTPATPASPRSQPEAIDFSKWGEIRREPLTPLRRTVSRRMTESWTTIPKINQFDEVDITGLLALRKKYARMYEKQGVHLTLTPFIIKALVRALQKHPLANASLDQKSGEIVFKNYYHMGVAVDSDAGLIVPVIRDVDKKGLLDLSRELEQLTEKARQRKLSLEELQGGTFTISNQGSIGSGHFTPIIYAPQVAILGVGQGTAKPVAVTNKVQIRTMLPVCLSYDHRALDGGNAVRFLMDIIGALQSFPENDVKVK